SPAPPCQLQTPRSAPAAQFPPPETHSADAPPVPSASGHTFGECSGGTNTWPDPMTRAAYITSPPSAARPAHPPPWRVESAYEQPMTPAIKKKSRPHLGLISAPTSRPNHQCPPIVDLTRSIAI